MQHRLVKELLAMNEKDWLSLTAVYEEKGAPIHVRLELAEKKRYFLPISPVLTL